MAARKTHDLAVVVRTYTDRDGNTKRQYQNIGVLMEGDKGPFVMLEKWFNPAGIQDDSGRSSLMVSCFAPKGQEQPKPKQQPQQSDDFEDDIPFN